MASAAPPGGATASRSPSVVEVIGGGPGGLYAARLLKLWHPEWVVRLHERNPPDATFGFGIGLNAHTLRRMADADPVTYEGLLEIGHGLRTWNLRLGSRSISGGDNQSIGLSRAGMLRVLADHAAAVGVEIEWGRAVGLDDVDVDADLVIAADGAGSGARSRLADELGVTTRAGGLAYIWCGAEIELDTMQFEIVETPHGVFVAHVMPYTRQQATFQVDARLDAIRRAGLDIGRADHDGDDLATLEYLSAAFAPILDGGTLRGNRSVWSTFTTVSCHRWSAGNVVLLGDAAHTAHYSVGSGTRMAMEDALGLAEAIDAHDELAAALRSYEANRRPSVERLQSRALRSQAWWASFPDRMHLPLPQLMASYQTRTGALGASSLAKADPDLVEAALRHVADDAPGLDGDPLPAILERPLRLARTTLPRRVVSNRGADVVDVVADVTDVARARRRHPDRLVLARLESGQLVSAEAAERLIDSGADAVHLRVEADGANLLDRLEMAERLRLTGAVVAVESAGDDLDQLAAGILAGRLDLVTTPEAAAR